MTVAFFFNYLNHHQVFVADEMHRLLGDDFAFVATLPLNEKELKGGIDYSTRPYCVVATASDDNHRRAMSYAVTADVCVFGACSEEYAVARATRNPNGLSFEVAERWLKRGVVSFGSSVLRRWLINYFRYYRKANFFKLCCSAFAAQDDKRMHAYRGKHYKWGYFTQVDENWNVEASLGVSTPGPTTLMWCSRFLVWKHPELPVHMAARLKANGYKFVLDMYGDGVEREHTETLARKLGVDDVVSFKGNVPNKDVLKAMYQHEIFLFTSDKYEGWGAVANEAMSQGCVLVGSDAIGSMPYLICDGENGMMFKSGSVKSLYEKTKYLLDNPNIRLRIANKGFDDIHNIWSPQVAAQNLLCLIDDLIVGRETSVKYGPCSKA